MFNQSSDFLIGELLLKAGLINKDQLDEALKLAGNKHMQIGQMLIMARRITPRDLQAAIDAQSAVRDRVMETNAAIRALKVSCGKGISFHEACQEAPQDQTQSNSTNRLGELLTGSGLVSSEQLAHAMQRSMATGLPLGRMLVLSGVINETILAVTLETQIRLRDAEITREEAIACLREMGGTRAVNQSGTANAGMPSSKPLRKTGIRLGELLVMAGILSEMDVMNALEVSLVKEKQLGHVLVEHGYITEEYCEMALKLQSLIDSGNLDSQQAADSLKSVLNGSMSLVQAVEQVTSATDEGVFIDFQSLITESQLLSQEQIQSAMELAVSSPRSMAKILIMTGALDEARSEVLLACYEALIKKKISWPDALNMLAYSWQTLKAGQMSIDELLQQLNLTRQVDISPSPAITPRLSGPAQASTHSTPPPGVSQQNAAPQKATAQTIPAQPVPMRSAPAQTPPAQPAPMQTAPVQAAPAPMQTAPAQAPPAPMQTAPAQAPPVQPAPMQTAPVQAPPVKPAPMQTAPVQAAPVQAPPAQPAPMQTAPAQAPLAQAPPAPMQTAPIQTVPSNLPHTPPDISTSITGQAPTKSHTGKTTGQIPALSQSESNLMQPTQAPDQQLPARTAEKRARTGKTTTNVPAINPLLVGNESVKSDSLETQKEQPDTIAPPKQSISLKGLLTAQEVPSVGSTQNTPAQAAPRPSNGSGPSNTVDTQNDPQPDSGQEELKLSEEEKKLIEIASSLAARPEDIMAAMKLVIQKEKSQWQKSQEKQ